VLPVWIYGTGDRKEAWSALSLPLKPEVWLPFVSEQRARQGQPLLILLLGAPVGEDSLVLSHAIALHEAGRARVIPVFLHDPATLANSLTRPQERLALERLRALPGAIDGTRNDWTAALQQALLRETQAATALAAPEPSAAIDVFYSYAHPDEPLRDELARHLKALERSGLIHQWYDRCILPGTEWAREIDINLHTADIVLLLVSPDFLASDYCQEIELPIAMERHKRRSARVVPVILRPALWQYSELSRLAALPKDGRPVALWESRDAAFVSVCEGIVSLVLAWKSETAKPVPASPAVRAAANRKRVLDAALPDRIPQGRSAILAVMLRRLSSPGLRAVVEANLTYGIEARDVRSEPVQVRFTADAEGKFQPRDLMLRVESPDFSPTAQAKPITVPPAGDSEPCIFLLAASRAGELKVVLELWDEQHRIATCLLATTATAEEEPLVRARPSVVSAVFDMLSEEEASRQVAVAAAVAQAERLQATSSYAEALAVLEHARSAFPESAELDQLRAEIAARQREMARLESREEGKTQVMRRTPTQVEPPRSTPQPPSPPRPIPPAPSRATSFRYCPVCTAPNPPGSKTCQRCGAPLEDTGSYAATSAATPASAPERSRVPLYLAIGAIVLLVLFYFLRR
jgi:hypothetical protein